MFSGTFHGSSEDSFTEWYICISCSGSPERSAKRTVYALMSKKYLIVAFLLAAVVTCGVLIARTSSAGQRATVYKTPTCGCCAKWVDHLEANGFRVKVVDLADVTPVKIRYGIPADLGSCHTALVSGYFVEGHVPAEEIHRMLETDEPIAGLAVPGMPMGSPGMEGPRSDPYDIVAVEKDGGRRIFASR